MLYTSNNKFQVVLRFFHLQVFHNDTKTFKKVNKTFWNCFKLFIYFLHFSFFSTYDKVEKKKKEYHFSFEHFSFSRYA